MKRCFEFKYIPCNNNDSNRRAIYRRMTGRERERGAAAENRSSILWSSIIKRAIKVIRILWAPAIILIEVYCCRPHLVHFTAAAAAADVTTIGLAQRCTKNVSEKRSKAPAEEKKKKKNKSRIKCLLSPAAMNLWLSVISIPSSSRSCG